jgi:hypothetical protein
LQRHTAGEPERARCSGAAPSDRDHCSHAHDELETLAAAERSLPLFPRVASPVRLELVEARPFPSGVVLHVYEPA